MTLNISVIGTTLHSTESPCVSFRRSKAPSLYGNFRAPLPRDPHGESLACALRTGAGTQSGGPWSTCALHYPDAPALCICVSGPMKVEEKDVFAPCGTRQGGTSVVLLAAVILWDLTRSDAEVSRKGRGDFDHSAYRWVSVARRGCSLTGLRAGEWFGVGVWLNPRNPPLPASLAPGYQAPALSNPAQVGATLRAPGPVLTGP